MSVTLAEALEGVDLEAGRVYRCRVRGRWVELRVLGPVDAAPAAAGGLVEDDVMLDPWVEFPGPEPKFTVAAALGPLPPPDAPLIPPDEDAS